MASTATQLAMHADPTDPRHGTLNGYVNLGCRCQLCRDAQAAYVQQARSARKARPTPPHVHGTENGYSNYKCRCRPCTDAYSSASVKRAKARRAKKRSEKKSSEG